MCTVDFREDFWAPSLILNNFHVIFEFGLALRLIFLPFSTFSHSYRSSTASIFRVRFNLVVCIVKAREILISKLHEFINCWLIEFNGNVFNNQNHLLDDKLCRSSFFIYFEFTIISFEEVQNTCNKGEGCRTLRSSVAHRALR